MKKALKAYRVQLEAIGPVFVGSGKELTKKEYIFLSKDKIGILDTLKMYQFMQKRHLQSKFEDYVVNDFRQDMGQWLNQNNIKLQEISPCIKYVLDIGDTALQRGTKISILSNMKDAYGLAYIPGSTIKGMLRTILLAKDILDQQTKYDADRKQLTRSMSIPAKNRNTYLQRDIRNMEAEAFRILQREGTKPADAVNDILSGIIVGDSDPIEMNKIILCQRLEKHTDGTNKPLNVLRECIRPGTMIEFMLTIDETVCKLTIEDIAQALKAFNRCYNECFLSAYRDAELMQEDNVFLGGGVGFVSKTVVYPMLGKKEGIRTTQAIFENTKVPRIHKHNLDSKLGVSPHILKCTKYEGKIMQMGLCRVASVHEEM